MFSFEGTQNCEYLIAQDFAFYARRRGSEERSVLKYVSTGATEDNTAEGVKDKQFAQEIFRSARNVMSEERSVLEYVSTERRAVTPQFGKLTSKRSGGYS